MTSSRAIALQGIGFAAALLAVQGFAPTEPTDPATTTPIQQTRQTGGGVGDNAGQGYIWRDNAWIKATKLVTYSTSVQYTGTVANRAYVVLEPKKNSTRFPASKVFSAAHGQPESRVAVVTAPQTQPLSHSFSLSCCKESIVSRYNGAYEALSMDEIMVLIEMAT